jgi:hypothetical protein
MRFTGWTYPFAVQQNPVQWCILRGGRIWLLRCRDDRQAPGLLWAVTPRSFVVAGLWFLLFLHSVSHSVSLTGRNEETGLSHAAGRFLTYARIQAECS